MLHLCQTSSMHVLGTVNPSISPQAFDPKLIVAYTELSSPFPRVASPNDSVITIQIIIFERPSPRRMQYLSLDPISLVLGDKFLVEESFYSMFDSEGIEAENAREQRERLIDKLQLHTVVKHPPSKKETLLPIILNQVNCSWELAQLLDDNQYLLGSRQKRSLSMGERVVESATTIWDFIIESMWHVLTAWLYPLLTRAFVTGLICHRFVAEIVLRVLEWRPGPEAAALKDVSATAQQVDIRLQQFCYWPIQYLTLRKRKTDWESITDRHPDYIRFYNSLWLVANDVIIGIALGSYIIDNADWVAWQINYVLSGWTVDGLRNMIEWLMDWPAGLKLNNELARFLGDLFLWVIEYWAGELDRLKCERRCTLTPLRMRCQPTPVLASSHLFHRILKFCRSHHADFAVFRSPVAFDSPHLLLLHRLCSNIPLAIDDYRLTLSPLPRQKA